MAAKDYKFTVMPADHDPFGPAGKENMDVIRLIFDFTCYLEPGEVIQQVAFPTIEALAPGSVQARNWRVDYQLDCPTTTPADSEPPPDLYPLRVVSEAITNLGAFIELRVNAGTPGFSYVVSFVIVASDTRRRKQIDTIVQVETALNSKMVGPGDLDPDVVPPIIIDDSTALPMGFDGLVILQNSGDQTGIVITLPPNPAIGQIVDFIDALGKDAAFPVTFRGDGDVPIDGDGRTVFVSSINYDVLSWTWMGTNWHLSESRFGFMA